MCGSVTAYDTGAVTVCISRRHAAKVFSLGPEAIVTFSLPGFK